MPRVRPALQPVPRPGSEGIVSRRGRRRHKGLIALLSFLCALRPLREIVLPLASCLCVLFLPSPPSLSGSRPGGLGGFPVLFLFLVGHHLCVVSYRVSCMPAEEVERCRRVRVSTRTYRQPPLPLAGVAVNVGEFLHYELFGAAFLAFERILPYLVALATLAVLVFHCIVQLLQQHSVAGLLQAPHKIIGQEPLGIADHLVQGGIAASIV